jgi:predicted TIM-barrel fold metal-dependent hydrolase
MKLAPLDMHVHLVGNGRSGSGCWLRVGATWWHKPLVSYMLRHVGLRGISLQARDFDERFVAHLVRLVRTSSLGNLVLLAQDEVYTEGGAKVTDRGTFYVPNDYLFEVCQQYGEFLPAVSIHPARPDAMDELERCLELGAVMLKLLPNCHNIDCNSPRYRRFWERMAEAGLPLLAHTGGEHTVDVVEPAYSDPRYLIGPLEIGVTVIAAHSATRSGLRDPEYFDVFAEMLEHYPNLYGDTSAWNVPMRGRHANRCIGPEAGLLSERLVHGSDFPVPCSGLWAALRRYAPWGEYRKWQRQPNVLERDYRMKLAMGFKEEHFTRAWSLLRRPLSEIEFDSGQFCVECNRSGAAQIGDRLLCLDCYTARGSCCVEFEGDDE